MQYTQSSARRSGLPALPAPSVLDDLATPSVTLALPTGPRLVPLRDLPALFATIPDPRRAQRREYSLAAILAAMLAALLAQHLSQLVQLGLNQHTVMLPGPCRGTSKQRAWPSSDCSSR